MLEAFDENGRQVAHLGEVAPHVVADEDGHDLVVSLSAIDELQTAHHPRLQQDLRLRDGTLADDADVERISVASLRAGSQTADAGAAVRTRDESVEGGRDRR